nr:hypothetical protein CFP56_49625 [Quercus suber]
MKIKAQELRNKAHEKKEQEEKKLERQREKERIRASKDLTEAKRMVESKERQRSILIYYLALKKKEKEEEKRAREKILKKLEHDKVERRSGIGLPPESPSVKPSTYLLQEKAL